MKLQDKLSRLGSPSLRTRALQGDEARTSSPPQREERASESSPSHVELEVRGADSFVSFEGDARSTRVARLRAQLELLQRKAAPRVPSSARLESRPLRFDHAPTCDLGPLPGDAHETPHGPLRRVITQHDEDHKHGTIPVALALEACATDLAVLALDPTLETVDFRRALYIDTETTGLLGGAGTLPFLIGMGWFEGRSLVVEQLLLERPGYESPMLARLSERLAWASCVVSYNGKSFDWPLLRTRFILNRVASPKVPAHLDLLHCARRVYKRRLGAVRLVHLEEEILGFTRVDDIAGEQIPQTYLGFLRGTVPGGALRPVVDHNLHDLVALAAILGELVRRFRREGPGQDPRDQLGFAHVAARAEDHARALAFAHAAAETDVRGELAPEALYLAGELKLRAGDLEAAVSAFERSLEAACGAEMSAARAHLALAKLCEHKLKEYRRALQHARQTAPIEGEGACLHRVTRLEKKCRTGAVLP